MNHPVQAMNEREAATAFNKQAPLFDDLYSADSIIQYKRQRVRDHIIPWLKPNSDILELNAGTGDDAIYFATQGHRVHATDISPEMQHVLTGKVNQYDLRNQISNELRSYTDLDKLVGRGPYDLIFSNFAGLNCSNQLPGVLRSFGGLLKPGGLVTLVVLPKFCLWEFMLVFKGKFKTALRRFSGSNGAIAHIEGEYFRCWYYNSSFVRKHLKENFELIGLEGLCTIVPPSYLQGFAEKYPKTYQWLVQKENIWKTRWPWKAIGDYYIITLRKKK